MHLVSMTDLTTVGHLDRLECPKSYQFGENNHCWIGRIEYVQIAKSASQTFEQEIYEKEMHLALYKYCSE